MLATFISSRWLYKPTNQKSKPLEQTLGRVWAWTLSCSPHGKILRVVRACAAITVSDHTVYCINSVLHLLKPFYNIPKQTATLPHVTASSAKLDFNSKWKFLSTITKVTSDKFLQYVSRTAICSHPQNYLILFLSWVKTSYRTSFKLVNEIRGYVRVIIFMN